MKNLKVDGNFHYNYDSYMFEENFENLRGDTYVYTNWGNIKMPEFLEDLWELPKVRRGKYLQFLVEYHNYNDFSWVKCDEDAISEIFNQYSLKNCKDFVYDLESFGLTPIPKFERYITNGYSQGDSAEIFVPHSLMEVWGITDTRDLIDSPLRKAIDNYCWDSEIYGEIEISFNYEVTRPNFGDSEVLEFNETFEYPEWGIDSYGLDINIDGIIEYIQSKIWVEFTVEEVAEIRKLLEDFDYNDIKY